MLISFKSALNSGLFKSSGVYTISSFINASLPFLLIPFLTRYLTPEDYGIVSMATILINILAPSVGISAHGAIQRKYFEVKGVDFSTYVGNSFFILIFTSLFLMGLFFLFNTLISEITELPKNWLYVILFIAISQFCSLILLTIWQAQVKPLNFGVLQISQSFINFGLTILLISLFNIGWEGRILAQLVAAFGAGLFAILFMLKKRMIRLQIDYDHIKDILNFSLPLIPHTLGGLMIAFTDRILITNMMGISETGIYTLAYQMGSVLGILTASFNSAYIPWLYEKLSEGNHEAKKKIVQYTYLYFISLIIIALLSSLILPWFVKLLAGDTYEGASAYTFWIILGYVFNGMYLMVSAYLFYAKKTEILSKITIISAILNFPLCYFFILHFGTIGAAFSMSIVFFLSFILTWIYSFKEYPMPWFTFNKE